MPTALVVDDSQVDQRLAGGLLTQRADLKVVYATDGVQALAMLNDEPIDLVLTDMQMPQMGGLELVEAIRKDHPRVPVILMTGHGSESIAAEALRRGAAGYVPKRFLSRDLERIVERALTLHGVERHQRLALATLTSSESQFVLGNDPDLVQPLIHYLRQDAARFECCDETAMMRVAVALDEALVNAMEHGNLEADSALRELGGKDYLLLVAARRTEPPYCDRRVYLTSRVTHDSLTYIIRDEGKGFDPASLPDPTDPANLVKSSGRGLLLIRAFMDEVHHNEVGNEITMIKYRERLQCVEDSESASARDTHPA